MGLTLASLTQSMHTEPAPEGIAWLRLQGGPTRFRPDRRSKFHPAKIPRTLPFGVIRRRTPSIYGVRIRAWTFADVRPGELPKLDTRVRFPSPALRSVPVQGRFLSGQTIRWTPEIWQRAPNVPRTFV